jgi:outer membrane protein assembly factor BamB
MKSLHFKILSFTLILYSCVSPSSYKKRRGDTPPRSVLSLQWEKTLINKVRFSKIPEQFSSPVVHPSGKQIFIGTSKGEIWSISFKGGTIWKTKLNGPVKSTPLIILSKKILIVGTIGGGLVALDIKTGKKKWRFQGFGSFLGEPVYSNGVIYATTSKNMLYAVDSDDGSLHWSKRHETFVGYTVRGHSSPLIVGKYLYFGLSDGKILALDIKKRGAVIWSKQLEKVEDENYIDADAVPLYKNNSLFVATYRKGVKSLDPKTGDLNWNFPSYGVTSLSYYKDRLYFVSPKNGIYCIDLNGKIIWRQHTEFGTPGKIIFWNNRMLITFDKGGIIALDAKTGLYYQRFDSGSGISGNSARYKNYLVTLGNNGKLYLFKLK